MRLWFAWACDLSRRAVEPLYQAARSAGYDCVLEPRGGYDDLPVRMKAFTHFIFGVGPDISWRHARNAGVIGINIMHGQYVLNTWFAPVPRHVILTGEIYADDARECFREPADLYAPGYILAPRLGDFRRNPVSDIDCLVTLPKIEEHPSLDTWQFIHVLRELPGVVIRVHPRNSGLRAELQSLGVSLDDSPTFHDALRRARCLLSGPSNCLIESCLLGIPAGLLALRPTLDPLAPPDREQERKQNYFRKLSLTYAPIATIFNSADQLRRWVRNPVARPPEAAFRYWANPDGNIQPILSCFLQILQKTANSGNFPKAE